MNKITTLLAFTLFFFAAHTQAQELQEPQNVTQGPHASIEFEQQEFNFGTITQGEKVKNVFVFTNTSETPLIIYNAKGSCGCTVPEWPREPILPGESSQLMVVFDSKGKKGNTAKRVTITANTEIPNTYLTLKGTIALEDDKEEKIEIPKNRTVEENYFSIYPNPTSEMVNIDIKGYEGEKAKVEIFDHSGKLMSTRAIPSVEKKSYRIQLDNYVSGIYTATIVVGDKMRLAKQFVVQ